MQSIGLVHRKRRVRQVLAQFFGQHTVELHRVHIGARAKQGRREGSAARADFHEMIACLRPCNFQDVLYDLDIDKEVLPKLGFGGQDALLPRRID